jgi:V-type H+-transporting ATPase subunit F
MATPEGKLIAVIGDEDTVTGFVLAGVGNRNVSGCNFLVVKENTAVAEVEEAFTTLTQRDDIGILLINQHCADMIRPQLNEYTQPIPTILEIPSKEHPYDAEKDLVMQRVNMMLGLGA